MTALRRTIEPTMKTDLHSDAATAAPHTLDYGTPGNDESPLLPPKRPPPATWLRVLISVVVMVALMAVAGQAFSYLTSTKPTATKTSVTALPPLVDVIRVDPTDVRETYLGYGTARAEREATVAAEVMGRIVSVPGEIDDGNFVEQGAVLAEVDKRDYENALELAQAQLADIDARLETLDVEKSNNEQLIEIAERELQVSEAEYQRIKSLRESGNASKKELDFSRLAAEQSRRQLQTLRNAVALIPVRKAELRATKAAREVEIERARINLTKATIRAPISGQLDQLFVDSGDMTMQGAQVARIINTDLIEVPVELPLAVRNKVKIGAIVSMWMDSATDERWMARVVRLAPIANEASRTFLAYLEVDNREQELPLMPGSFITARIDGKMIRDALVIPRGVMVGDDVFVAKDGRVVRKQVTIRALIGDKAVVGGDIEPGDRVITSNLDILFAGSAVRVAGDATVDATDGDGTEPALTIGGDAS